jgi:hypothetical protein
MARIIIRSADEAAPARPLDLPGLGADGEVTSRPVVAGWQGGLSLWRHEIGTGGALHFAAPDRAHLLYVWAGEADAGGAVIARGDALMVEAGAVVSVTASHDPLVLLHYHADAPDAKDRLVHGQIHALRRAEVGQRVHPNTDITLFADSSAEGADLWFHAIRSSPRHEVAVEPRHYHTADEIIVIVDGEMLLGRRRIGPGTAVAIAGRTLYAFGMGEAGVHFVNFRSRPSSVAMLTPDGVGEARDERIFMNSLPIRYETAPAA